MIVLMLVECTYKILEATLINCGDKGISVGELSTFELDSEVLVIQILEFQQKIFQNLAFKSLL